MQEILHDVVHFYQYVVIERVPGPRSISYFLPFILLPVALMIPPSRLSRQWLTILFVPLITASTVHAWIAMGGVDVISADLLLESLHLIWFENVRVVYRRVIRERVGKESDRGLTGKALDEQSEARPQTKDPNRVEGVNKLPAPIAGVKSHDEPYPTDIMARLRWVGNLVSSTRGNGWKIGSKNHDARQSNLPQPPTRMAFALALIPGMIRNSLLLSLTTLFSRYDPYFNDAGSISVSTPYPRSPTYHEKPMIISILQIIPPPILRPMVIGLTAYSILTLGYYVPAPLAVASNYYLGIPNDDWSPHTNGRYFGPFSSVLDLGVRGVWGRWWHDQMRIVTSAPGVALSKALGLRTAERTQTSAYLLQLISAFFFSGVVHTGLVPPSPHYAQTRTPTRLKLLIAYFFWSQTIPIVLEVILAGLIKVREDTIFRKVLMRSLRFAWTVAWMCLTISMLAIPFAELGYWKLVPPGFPLLMFLA